MAASDGTRQDNVVSAVLRLVAQTAVRLLIALGALYVCEHFGLPDWAAVIAIVAAFALHSFTPHHVTASGS